MREHDDEGILWRIERLLERIDERTRLMALDQATFDSELGDLVAAVGQLGSAVDAFVASHQGTDLTAEGQQVTDAAAQVQAALDKLSPATPATPASPADGTAS